jgi:hypothetical protein
MIRGGAWGDNTYMFGNLSEAPAMERSPKDGFRCAVYPDPKSVLQAAFGAMRPPETKDLYKEKPVPDAVFQVYKEQFSYDRTDLEARVESREERPGWIHETVSFAAAYGGERILAHLFLPRNSKPRDRPYSALQRVRQGDPGLAGQVPGSGEALGLDIPSTILRSRKAAALNHQTGRANGYLVARGRSL